MRYGSLAITNSGWLYEKARIFGRERRLQARIAEIRSSIAGFEDQHHPPSPVVLARLRDELEIVGLELAETFQAHIRLDPQAGRS